MDGGTSKVGGGRVGGVSGRAEKRTMLMLLQGQGGPENSGLEACSGLKFSKNYIKN